MSPLRDKLVSFKIFHTSFTHSGHFRIIQDKSLLVDKKIIFILNQHRD